MFYHLEGIISELEPNLAVIDCNGIGFAVNTSAYSLSKLEKGSRAKLYTVLSVREGAMELYGFSTYSERQCFQLLTSVSGIGPKAALNILSTVTPSQLSAAIVSGNEKALTAAQGIGKKIAQRVILELKDKFLAGDEFGGPAGDAAFFPAQTDSDVMRKAAAVLCGLGYKQGEAAAALKGIDGSLPLDTIVKLALKNMLS